MHTVLPVAPEWLALFVNGYSPQTRAATGADAVPAEYADREQRPGSALATVTEKEQLAGRLWQVFGGPALESRVAALDALVVTSSLTPHVQVEGRLTWTTPHESAVGRLAAACTACLVDAVTARGWSRLGTCGGRDCLDVYLDRVGRAPRRYCSPTCLNRAKVRAFRSRQAAP